MRHSGYKGIPEQAKQFSARASLSMWKKNANSIHLINTHISTSISMRNGLLSTCCVQSHSYAVTRSNYRLIYINFTGNATMAHGNLHELIC